MLEPRRHRPSARRRPRRPPARRRGLRATPLAWGILGAGVISAGALAFYGILNGGFRPDAEWRNLVTELTARGEPLFFSDVVPAEVPDEENFFGAPVFDGLASGAPQSDLLQKAGRPLAGKHATELLSATAQPDGGVRLDPIADAFAAEQLLDAEYLLPADRVIAGMRELGISFDPLAEAAQRPGARFEIDYASLSPALPHLGPVEALGNWLAIDGLARIGVGNGTAAAADILMITRLADALSNEPFLASQRTRRNLLSLAAGCIRAGIDGEVFDDGTLERLSAALQSARPVEDFARAVRGERAALNTVLDDRRSDLPQADAKLCEAWLGAGPDALSPRELRARRIAANTAIQAFLDQLGNPAGIVPAALLPPPDMPAPPRIADLAAEAGAFAQVQTYLAQAVIACALERHRFEQGQFPEALEALSPDFLPELPLDPMTGLPPSYENDGTSFILTGGGWNGGPAWIWKG